MATRTSRARSVAPPERESVPDDAPSADANGRHVNGFERAANAAIGVAVLPVVAAQRLGPHAKTGLYYTGLAALTAAGAIELPVAGAIAAGVWVARRR